MPVEVLILDSGEWVLAQELAADPWRVLIYRDRVNERNELHLWVPREASGAREEFALRRFWMDGATRWCVEMPPVPARPRGDPPAGETRLRFSASDGRVYWTEYHGPRRLGDFTGDELVALRDGATAALNYSI